MYHFIVTIENPPLAIQRYFTCVDEAQADRFIGWLDEQGLTYGVTYTEPDNEVGQASQRSGASEISRGNRQKTEAHLFRG